MNNLNVLFVDDELFALHSMERLLSKQNYGKYFAQGGQEALEILASAPIHIIVSDMKMPGMDGLSLLMAVKEKYPDIVRLVLSGYSQTAQLLPCINRGEIFRFITKPLSADELITSINDALELVNLRAEKNDLTEALHRKNIELSRALEERDQAREQLKTLNSSEPLPNS